MSTGRFTNDPWPWFDDVAVAIPGLWMRADAMIRRVCIAICLLVVGSPPCLGATWRVAKDGSGQFTTIQAAVNAASSGDVILLAPGRYEETHVVEFPGGPVELIAMITQARLIIRGEDRNSVILGPATLPAGTEARGLVARIGASMTVEDLSIENLCTAIQANGDRVVVRNCEIRDCTDIGVDSHALYATQVLQSTFRDVAFIGVIVFGGLNSVGVEIRDCTFISTDTGGAAIDLQTRGNVVQGCTFLGTGSLLQFSFGATGVISNCYFEDVGNSSVGIIGGSSVEIRDCVMAGNSAYNLFVAQGSHVSGTGNLLTGGWLATVLFSFESTMNFHGNHILNGGGWSVFTSGGDNPADVLDLSNNYWGTTDPNQIATWIRDGNDLTAVKGTVQFEPFYGVPIGAETTTFSDLKRRFGGDN